MKWKVGDEIIFVKNGIIDSCEIYGFIIGQKYKIIYIEDNTLRNMCNNYSSNGRLYQVNGPLPDNQYFIEPNSFRLAKKELNSEVDYLNAFQDNFKNGI